MVLFKCKWYDVHDNVRGANIYEYGFTSINPQRFLKINEPFILANQASQVFYAIDNINKGWHVVVKTQPRDLYDMPSQNDAEINNMCDDLGEAYQHDESFNFKCSDLTSINIKMKIIGHEMM